MTHKYERSEYTGFMMPLSGYWQANPEYGSMEYEIPDAVTLRIPYPLNETLTKYNEAVAQYYELY